MKRFIVNILSLFLVSVSVYAIPADSLQKGNDYYKYEKYEEAINTYIGILTRGYESSALYFNLGNAYYKTKNIPSAILNYERAKILSPNDESIEFNIAICNQFVVDKIEPLPQPIFVRWFHMLLNTQSANGWGFISLIAFIFLLVSAGIYIFFTDSTLKKISFGIALAMLVVTVSSFVFGSKQKSKITHRNEAIIFSPTVTVKSSPDESGTGLFVIHEGLKVMITESVGGWYEIRIADGNAGWVKKDVLEKI